MSSAACWEVGVLGGGPAGATAARCLAWAGVSTVLIDQTTDKGGVGEGLPPGAKPLLRTLGLWDAIGGDGHLASCGNESAWGSPHLYSTASARQLGAIFTTYLKNRREYYAQERRWASRPFWRRRVRS